MLNNEKVLDEVVGKIIRSAVLDDDSLVIEFDDCTLTITDEGQQCCEYRYMTTDDNLSSFVGAAFVGADTSSSGVSSPNYNDNGEEEDTMFLNVRTGFGVFTMETHNEHNGYYGGFEIFASLNYKEVR